MGSQFQVTIAALFRFDRGAPTLDLTFGSHPPEPLEETLSTFGHQFGSFRRVQLLTFWNSDLSILDNRQPSNLTRHLPFVSRLSSWSPPA